MPRIAVGGFLRETNTFAPTKATYADFVHGGGWPSMAHGADVLRVMFRYVGIEPTEQAILVNKSSVHFRADFEPIAERLLICAAPGAMPADTAALPWTRLRPGIRIKPNGPAFVAANASRPPSPAIG